MLEEYENDFKLKGEAPESDIEEEEDEEDLEDDDDKEEDDEDEDPDTDGGFNPSDFKKDDWE